MAEHNCQNITRDSQVLVFDPDEKSLVLVYGGVRGNKPPFIMRRTIFTIPKELQKDSSIELFYHCQQTSTPENGEELALEFRVNLATKDNKPADIFPFNSLGRLNFEEIKCAYCHKVGPWKKDRTEVYIGSTKGWAYEHKAPEKT